jgi:oligoribonuclease
LKELALRWAPRVVDTAPKKESTHRALDDIRESVAELRWYREHLFREIGDGSPTPTPTPPAAEGEEPGAQPEASRQA